MLSKNTLWSLLLLMISLLQQVQAQNSSSILDTLQLRDLTVFKPASASWKIVGDVYVNREKVGHIKTSAGEEILISTMEQGKQERLETNWQHQDMDLELEFMLSKGASAKILLQGLYEVVLNDSWGSKEASRAACGGLGKITAGGEVLFNGIAPLVNACKAPGTWQKIFISFVAPVYDQQGRKIKEAHINRIVLNNIIIHENLDLTLTSTEQSEQPKPLMFVSGAGPVAFRNIGYLFKKHLPVLVKDIKYHYYEEKLNKMPDFDTLTAKISGHLEKITWQPALHNDGFAFKYTGKLIVPETVPYTFTLVSLGGSALSIDGKTVLEHMGTIDHDGRMSRQINSQKSLTLEKGVHEFKLAYFKNTWAPIPILGIFVEGKGNYVQALHDESSYPDEEVVSSILLEPAEDPYVLRAFMRFQGKRKTYCVAVGDPSGLHYAYDLSDGSLLKAWRGAFVDATPMWHERGSQVLELPASGVAFSDAPELAQLTNAERTPWPQALPEQAGYFLLKGYELTKSGLPTFEYRIGTTEVHDLLQPNDNGTALTRQLWLSKVPADTYYRVTTGKKIEKMEDGTYAVNDKEFFIRLNNKKMKPQIRKIGGDMELLLPLAPQDQQISYSIIW